ncbi:MAG: hypothetical protein LBR98_05005 [Syntrophomonadaceae bacterium]|jgi:hypothetical protein|nr:hypothetical protein [Syntrophomonadaceae bacterium]
MGNRDRVKYLFSSSNTVYGYSTFIPELIANLSEVYVLTGIQGAIKSNFIKELGESLWRAGYEAEFWVSPLSSNLYEGVFFPQLAAAVIDGNSHKGDKWPGLEVRHTFVDLDQCLQEEKMKSFYSEAENIKEQVIKQDAEIERFLRLAGENYETAVNFEDEKTDRDVINNAVQSIIKCSLEGIIPEKHYYSPIVNIDGVADTAEEISSMCRRRFILKGASGGGRKEIFETLAAYAKSRNCFVEYYHDGLRPEKINMLVVPSLQAAILDYNSCKIIVKPMDIMIDLDGEKGMSDCDSMKNNKKQRTLETFLFSARNELKKKYVYVRALEKLYYYAFDFHRLEELQISLGQKIKKGIINI